MDEATSLTRMVDLRPRHERRHGSDPESMSMLCSAMLPGRASERAACEAMTTMENPEGDDAGSDASSRAGDSEYGGPTMDDAGASQQTAQRPIPCATLSRLRQAFATLDGISLKELFKKRACLLKGVPAFLRGPLRAAYRVALEEARRCKLEGDAPGRERAWKLFGLISRMLLHRPPGERLVPKDEFA